MNEQELNEIEARAEAATPGPWFWDTNRRYKSTMLKAPQNGGTCVMDFTRWGMQSAQPRFNDTCASFGGILYTMEQYDKTGLPNPNADFIAHARQDVPALAAEVRRLNGDNASLEYMLGERANENDLLLKEVKRLRAANEKCEWEVQQAKIEAERRRNELTIMLNERLLPLEQENKRLRAALEKIGDEANWSENWFDPNIVRIAMEALYGGAQ